MADLYITYHFMSDIKIPGSFGGLNLISLNVEKHTNVRFKRIAKTLIVKVEVVRVRFQHILAVNFKNESLKHFAT